MKTHLSVELFDEYLKITLTGSDNPYAEIEEIYTAVMRIAQENNRVNILVDAFNLPDVSETEKFYMGKLGAKIFGARFKCALLRKKHVGKFMENVAVNRGAQLLVTDNEKEALQWLLAP